MAIVQISQITNRLGLQVDLPQLAGGELGWSTDSRRLYIGNGTLAEGAPVVGNTELLTEFSDILNVASAYTYTGTEATGYTVQTGPTPGTPVVQSLQNWMDQYASVKDFGATGDGSTDDTAAINRALYQLYCRESTTQVRRALFFPAGTYVVSSTINIPSYATLVGDGLNASFIQMVPTGGTGSYVAQTVDSLQNPPATTGNGGATAPTQISINHMSFRSLDVTKSIFLVQSANKCEFNGVGFAGVTSTTSLENNTLGTACVNFDSQPSYVTTSIIFNGCKTYGTTYAVQTVKQTKGIVITNCNFSTHYQGIALGVASAINGGPSGTRITSCIFDLIYSSGITFGAYLTPGLNASAYNVFYNVANSSLDPTDTNLTPTASIVRIESNNNVSIGDMFERPPEDTTTYPQVDTADSLGATLNSNGLRIGSKTIESGSMATLLDAQSGATAFIVDVGVVNPSVSQITSFKIDYNIVQGTKFRTGTCMVASQGGGIVTFTDDYNENTLMNVYLYAEQTGDIVSFNYNTTPPSGTPSTFTYSVSYLN